MKIKILKIFILIFIILVLGIAFKDDIFRAQTNVKAFGDLIVNFHSDPLFTFSNIAPGDGPFKNIIDVNNAGNVPRTVLVKAIRKNGVGDDNAYHLEEALLVTINDGEESVYGPVTLWQFFDKSTKDPNGVMLGTIAAHAPKRYTMIIKFPRTADNKYQGTSVAFDLTFGTDIKDQLIINEVYYKVGPAHGLDSPQDRTNTGKNGLKLGQNDEWIELYNPTYRDISLKNWTLSDNSGSKVKINANQQIKKNGYVLIAKDSSTWKTWTIPQNYLTIQLGSQIGNGLDNAGDRLLLNNPDGTVIDAISWGNDKTIFNPSINVVTGSNNSIQRINPILIPDTAGNWKQGLPSPGKIN